jgi:hypothetical protein
MSDYKSSPYIGLGDPVKNVPVIPETAIPPTVNEPTLAERRGNPWYKKLSLSIRGNSKSTHYSMTTDDLESPVTSLEEHLNKPLPALPSPQHPPSFEYMFSDAGVRKKKSNATMTSSTDTEMSSEGEDKSQNAFLLARRPLTRILR